MVLSLNSIVRNQNGQEQKSYLSKYKINKVVTYNVQTRFSHNVLLRWQQDRGLQHKKCTGPYLFAFPSVQYIDTSSYSSQRSTWLMMSSNKQNHEWPDISMSGFRMVTQNASIASFASLATSTCCLAFSSCWCYILPFCIHWDQSMQHETLLSSHTGLECDTSTYCRLPFCSQSWGLLSPLMVKMCHGLGRWRCKTAFPIIYILWGQDRNCDSLSPLSLCNVCE